MRVLYIHMTGAFAGGCRSLYEVVRALPTGAVEPVFVAPRGSIHAFLSRLGDMIETAGISQFDNTRYGYYRGLRWLVLLREIAFVPSTIAGLLRARRQWKSVDLIHINEITGLLPWLLARRLFKVPVVVHVRSVVRDDRESRRTRWISRMLRDRASAVIAIDQNVRASLPPDLPVDVIHNSLSLDAPEKSAATLADQLKLKPDSFKIGFVGNLLRVKGIFELIEAARLTRDRGLNVEFVIVGGDASGSNTLKARILNRLGIGQDVGTEVKAKIAEYGLADRVHMVGFMANIARAYACMDVLCFPSHYDAPGRPIFEAAFLRVPSIAAVRKPLADTLVHGVTGLAVPPHDAQALADAIATVAADRALAARMGEAAYQMAVSNFQAVKNAAKLLEVYKRVTGAPHA
ncbi:glycosyltransferase family 4 protein [Bradyrhizobium sp. 149]|uniref:glycosyltransferase family 4 protein n=1 Tax=Bradyrhizobium sp. 149 TaxID=2782624 RepID=UPI001FF92A5A|nr:glycosyltransferase family 4 protein [Bradyrhizobium sp. 149]MCK1652712.1 glycosyltransferase family 4 protein [Bradyrhizobium sp. 149]